MTFDTSFSLTCLLEAILLSSFSPTLFFHLPTPSHPPPSFVISFFTVFLPCAQKLFIDAICKHCLCDSLPRTVSAYFYFQNCSSKIKMSRYAEFNAKYGSFDVRSMDNARMEERNKNMQYDLPRPFVPRPIPEGQIERQFMGPVDTPATIATRHRAVVQAVENFSMRRPDVARSVAEAGAAYIRRWEESRAAEMEAARAAGGEEAGDAQPEVGREATPGDAPEAEPEIARPPSIYVDDVAAAVNVEGSKDESPIYVAAYDSDDPEAPPPYAQRRSARGRYWSRRCNRPPLPGLAGGNRPPARSLSRMKKLLERP